MAKSPARNLFRRAFLCLLLSASFNTYSATPLQTRDLNPFTIIYGLPLISPARIPAQSAISFSLNVSNTINKEDKTNETLFIDGETTEFNLIFSTTFNKDTSIRAVLPYLKHEAGNLDSFIDDFHSLFGFSEGERPKYDNDQFLFLYQADNLELVNMNTGGEGLGDIRLEAGHQLLKNAEQAASIWTSYKLPTGDSEHLRGSGASDIALWYAYDYRFKPDWWRYYNIGLLITGDSDRFAGQQKNEVLFGTAGVEWKATPVLTLNIQIDFHTAFYDSSTRFLGDSYQISSGGHIAFQHNARLEIVVIEDLYIGASPDVTFQLGYTQLF